MNNAVKYRVIQITIANLAKNIDKVVTFLLKCMQLNIYRHLLIGFTLKECCCLFYHLS